MYLDFGAGGGLYGLLRGISPVHNVLEEVIDIGDHLQQRMHPRVLCVSCSRGLCDTGSIIWAIGIVSRGSGEGMDALARCWSLDPWTAMTDVLECFTMNSTASSPRVSYNGTQMYDMRLQAWIQVGGAEWGRCRGPRRGGASAVDATRARGSW